MTDKKHIFFFASEIAIITGHNPYEKRQKVIDRLVSQYFPELLEGYELIPLDNREFLEDLSKKTNIDISKELKATDNSKNTKELQINQKKLIDKMTENLKKDPTISNKQITEVKKAIKSATNTQFGTTYENDGIKKYTELTGENVLEDNSFRKYKLLETKDYVFYVGGRIDGFLLDSENTNVCKVVEVKNRMRKLFKKLRDYEKVQCHVYMKLWCTLNSDLIEIYKGKDETESNIINVPFSNTFYSVEVESRLFNFINEFLVYIENC